MEETILIDCNHLQSIQYTGGNLDSNNYYTNKIGSGIKVEQGDKISIHQTYISEIGSDDNSIQIENKFVSNKPFTYTKLTPHTYINGSNDKIMGYERVTASNITDNIATYNNETNILYNYYITSNGENTFNLPRRYIYKPPSAINIDWATTHDNALIGSPFEPPGLVSSVGIIYNNNNMNMFYVEDDYFFHQSGQSGLINSNRLKQRYDNARFTIFTLEETRYGSQSDDTLPSIINGSLTSPAYLNYIEYIEKLKINLKAGFQSPQAIASNITNILKTQTQPEIGTLSSTGIFSGNNLKQYQPYNLEINSPTYHTFQVASEGTMSEGKYEAWDAATADTGDSLDWLSAYQYIGIKRPQLWLKGRAFNNRLKEKNNASFPGTVPYINYASLETLFDLRTDEFERSNPIITSNRRHTVVLPILWDDTTTITKLKDLLNEQEKHPECFLNRFNQYNGFTNINNSRFLHINLYNRDIRKSKNENLYNSLGTDYLKAYENNQPYLQTSPFFFDCNPLYKNKITNGLNWDDGYLYGYFKKYIDDDDIEYISLTTDHLGFIEDTTLSASFTTIPNIYFLTNDGLFSGSIIKKTTRLGWDSSFNSFGNVCVGMLSGWGYNPDDLNSFNYQLPTGYNTTQLATYLYSRKLYLGANNPKLEYNTTSNRFEISQLHTSERVQNRFNSGTLTGTGDAIKEIAAFDTAGTEVYKINKRLYNNTYTPDMLPYGANRIEGLTLQTQIYDIDFKNPNIAGWSIFDSLSGIIIRDFGYNENDWNKGFWETLGFDYIQFNSIETADNDSTSRVGNNNKNTLPYAFTNANVDQLATMDMITNIWGNGIYNLMLPQTMSFNVTNTGGNANIFFRENMKFEQFPAITEAAQSIKLEAPRLPKKLQNPYYILKTDVLDTSPYLGGIDSGEPFNIIATIPKSNDYGDYFVSLDSGLEFTFTKPKLISSITSSIHNPNMSLANINDSSSIIYKITKQMNPNRFNIVGQIMDEEKNERNKK